MRELSLSAADRTATTRVYQSQGTPRTGHDHGAGTLGRVPRPRRLPRLTRDHFLDIRPLVESPAYARMWIGSTLGGLGGQLTIVSVMLHMYELTASTFAVSMIAVAGLLPMIVAGLYGGMLADAFDRRRIALLAASVNFGSTVLLMTLTWSGAETVAWLYVLSVVNSSANSVVMAARRTNRQPSTRERRPGRTTSPSGRILGSVHSPRNIVAIRRTSTVYVQP